MEGLDIAGEGGHERISLNGRPRLLGHARWTGVTANVLHPGVVNSGFGAEDPSRIFKFLVPFWRPFMKTPQQGAATSIYLASSPEVEGVTGTFFADGRPQTSNRASYDVAAAARLWQVSARLVGLGGESAGQVGQGASSD